MGIRDKKRNWFLTYPQTDLTMADLLDRLKAKAELSEYLIAQEHHSDGGLHLHAYIKFMDDGIQLKDAPQFFSVGEKSGNYQPCRSCKSVIQYCSKDGDYISNFDIESYLSKKRKLSVDTIQQKSARQALTDGDIGISSIKHYILARSILCEPYEHDDVRGVWLYGPPGVGKSRYVRDNHTSLYLKSQNKWFDGYEGEEAILLDDFDKPGKCLGHYLKIWTDRYSCTGEVKGGQVNLRHKFFIITSNYHMDEIFDEDPILVQALRRRFNIVKCTSSEFIPETSEDSVPEQYARGFNPGT